MAYIDHLSLNIQLLIGNGDLSGHNAANHEQTEIPQGNLSWAITFQGIASI
jgi:hypothetical protein